MLHLLLYVPEIQLPLESSVLTLEMSCQGLSLNGKEVFFHFSSLPFLNLLFGQTVTNPLWSVPFSCCSNNDHPREAPTSYFLRHPLSLVSSCLLTPLSPAMHTHTSELVRPVWIEPPALVAVSRVTMLTPRHSHQSEEVATESKLSNPALSPLLP